MGRMFRKQGENVMLSIRMFSIQVKQDLSQLRHNRVGFQRALFTHYTILIPFTSSVLSSVLVICFLRKVMREITMLISYNKIMGAAVLKWDTISGGLKMEATITSMK